MEGEAGTSSPSANNQSGFHDVKKKLNKSLNSSMDLHNNNPLFGAGMQWNTIDVKAPKSEPKSEPKQTVDKKPKLSTPVGSSHSYATPKNTFTKKTQDAEGKHININVCDPDGNTHVFNVWNKAPIFESVFKRYGDLVNYDIKVSSNHSLKCQVLTAI